MTTPAEMAARLRETTLYDVFGVISRTPDEAADMIEALQSKLDVAKEALREIEKRETPPTPSTGGVPPGQYAYLKRLTDCGALAASALAKMGAKP